MPDIFGGLERDLGRLMHRPDHPIAMTGREAGQEAPDIAIPTTQTIPAAQETTVSKLADAQAVIADAASNPLITALAEEGLGKILRPSDIPTVVSIVRTIENLVTGSQTPAQEQIPPMPPYTPNAPPAHQQTA
jgi:hypothetical protein